MSVAAAQRRRKMYGQLREARQAFLSEHGLGSGGAWTRQTHRIATDCSGLEAPIITAKDMGLAVEHLFPGLLGKKVFAFL